MTSVKNWDLAFLGVTILAVIMEFLAVYDADPNTQPWTTLFINNVPMWLGIPVVVAFSVWLTSHFIRYYLGNRKVNK